MVPVEEVVLLSPFDGHTVPMGEVPDDMFAERMLGDGIGVNPSSGVVLAPCAGVITHLAKTRHSVTLTTPEGAEIPDLSVLN